MENTFDEDLVIPHVVPVKDSRPRIFNFFSFRNFKNVLGFMVTIAGVIAIGTVVLLKDRNQNPKIRASGTTGKNVVVIMVDDLDEGSFQLLLDKGKLPNIESKLVPTGFRFSNSFVTHSMCCPSRASFITGKYAHNTCVWNVVGSEGGYPAFDRAGNVANNLAVWLNGAGYYTGHVGKFLTSSPRSNPPGWDFWNLTDGYDTRPGHYLAFENSPNALTPNSYETKYVYDRAKSFLDSFNTSGKKNFYLQLAPHAVHADIRGWGVNTVFPQMNGPIVGYGIYDHPDANIGRVQTLLTSNGGTIDVWIRGPKNGWNWVRHPEEGSFFNGTGDLPIAEFNAFVVEGRVRYHLIRGDSQDSYDIYSCDLEASKNPFVEPCLNWVLASGNSDWKQQNGDTRTIVGWSAYVQPNGVTRQEIIRGDEKSGYDLYVRFSTDWSTWIKSPSLWDYSFTEPSSEPIVSWNSFLENGDKIRHHLIRGTGPGNYKIFYTDENSFWGANWPKLGEVQHPLLAEDNTSNVLGVTDEQESLAMPLGVIEEDQGGTEKSLGINKNIPEYPFASRVWADGNWENQQSFQSFNYPNGYPAGSLRQGGDKNSFTPVSDEYGLSTDKDSFNYANCSSSQKPSWLCANWPDLNVVMRDGRTLIDYATRYQLDRLEALIGVDALVGAVYDELDARGLLNNTLIIFTSDNGYLMGEYRMGEKSAAYDDATRVPLIIKMPGMQGINENQLVANIDLAPTILDFVGLDWQNANYKIDGRSIIPILSGNMSDWRDMILLEHHYPKGIQIKEPYQKIPDYFGVRSVALNTTSDPFLYILYGDDPFASDGNDKGFSELYNIKNDKYQIQNVRNDSRVKAALDELEKHRLDLSVCSGVSCRQADIKYNEVKPLNLRKSPSKFSR